MADTALSGLDTLGVGLRDEIAPGLRVVPDTQKENLFPIDALPLGARDFASETAAHLKFPIDYTVTAQLVTAGAAVGNSCEVEVFPGFREGCNLQAVNVGNPGAMKTQPITAALQPIATADAESLNQFERDMKQYRHDLSIYTKSDGAGQEPQKPHFKSTIAGDFTPESLLIKHKHNPRGIVIHNDELIGFFKNFGRYHSGAEQQFYLEAFNRKSVLVERKSADPLYIKHPHISLIGTVQPGILSELAGGNRDKDGFLFRMLFAFPDNTEKQYWSDTRCSNETFSNWAAIINRLLAIELQHDEHGNPAPHVLRFAPDAFALLSAWQRENTDACNKAENEVLQGFISKFDFFAVRFSLILELLRYGCDPSAGLPSLISAESVRGAIKLCEYYLNTAKKVCNALTELSPLDKLKTDKRKLYDALPETFTTGDGWRLAEAQGIKPATYKRFIANGELFVQPKHGTYEKRF